MTCKYCEHDKGSWESNTPFMYSGRDRIYNQVALKMWLVEDIIRFYTWGYGSRRDYSIVINYCPMCGRKLDKKD